MVRRLNYHWRLRQVMAAHQLWKTTELIPLLRERGVMLSTAQVYRLVSDKPERMSMQVLAALCDIFDCGPGDLIDPYLEAAGHRKAVGQSTVVDLNPDFRPERARIIDDDR